MTDVEVTGGDLVGGLVASNLGTVKDVFVSGAVTQVGGFYAGMGGLAGNNDGLIEDSQADVSVTDYVVGSLPNAYKAVGGFVGRNAGEIIRSESRGEVTSASQRHVGGFVGHNEVMDSVSDSFSANTVAVTAFVSDELGAIGGLVGFNEGDITDSRGHGSVTGNRNVGGLVGRNGRRSIGVDILAPIIDSYSLSDAG